MVLVVAQLTAPAAPLADPLDEARLVGTLDGAIAAAWAQQLPLQDERHRVVRPRFWLAGRWVGCRLGSPDHDTETKPQALLEGTRPHRGDLGSSLPIMGARTLQWSFSLRAA